MAAANKAMRNAAHEGQMALLEPIMKLEVVVPEAYMGDILNDLNSRRGSVIDMGMTGDLRTIDAKAPLAEMFGYSTATRSLSQGRASHTMEPMEYALAPEAILHDILGV